MTPPKFSTVHQFVQDNPAFTEGGLRYQIFNEESNGLKDAGAIVRNGRRIYIHDERYFIWLLNRSKGD